MTTNPFVERIGDVDTLDPQTLALLAIVHELRTGNMIALAGLEKTEALKKSIITKAIDRTLTLTRKGPL